MAHAAEPSGCSLDGMRVGLRLLHKIEFAVAKTEPAACTPSPLNHDRLHAERGSRDWQALARPQGLAWQRGRGFDGPCFARAGLAVFRHCALVGSSATRCRPRTASASWPTGRHCAAICKSAGSSAAGTPGAPVQAERCNAIVAGQTSQTTLSWQQRPLAPGLRERYTAVAG